jgi:hypothetical protein
MYNTDIPTRAELPTTAQLIKSTIIALVTAIVLLVTIVLPSEYAIDPTGVGRMLKLTEMGEIKQQLAAEAEADRVKDQQPPAVIPPKSSLPARIFAELLIGRAQAQAAARSDETTITLKPGEGQEWKMTMAKGAQAQFSWNVQGGTVNYDMHASAAAGGKETSYKTARSVASDEGTLTASVDGTHGWFFRNRGQSPVTLVLKTRGAYSDIRKTN